MKGFPKTAVLKDGGEVVVRPLEHGDREALAAFFAALPQEYHLTMREDVTQPAVLDRWIEELDYDHILPLLAWQTDRIVADSTLRQPRFGWSRHVGEIRVAVLPEFQNRGLATLLLSELVQEAVRRQMDKIEALFMREQKAACRVFEKLGFHQEAVLRRHVRDIRGQRHDLIVMTHEVEDLWARMEDFLRVRALRMEY